jgi:hypothetical protein
MYYSTIKIVINNYLMLRRWTKKKAATSNGAALFI